MSRTLESRSVVLPARVSVTRVTLSVKYTTEDTFTTEETSAGNAMVRLPIMDIDAMFSEINNTVTRVTTRVVESVSHFVPVGDFYIQEIYEHKLDKFLYEIRKVD